MRFLIKKLLFLVVLCLKFNNPTCAQFYYIVSKNACLICDKIFNEQKFPGNSVFEQFVQAVNKVKNVEFILKFTKNDRNDHNFTNEFTSIVDNALTEYDQHFSRISDRLNQKRMEMLKLSNDTVFYNLFQSITTFYGPILGDNIPFVVYIVDELSEPFYINTTIFIQDSSRPKMFCFGELIRYFCEILYDYMPNKNEIASHFHSSSSRHAMPAFAVFKKVLAHSLSRWTIWNMGERNQLKTEDEIIDRMSSLIAPLLTDYLISGRQIDHDLIVRYIDIFATNFKDADKTFDIDLAKNIVIKADSKEIREFTFQCSKNEFKTKSFREEDDQEKTNDPVVTITDGKGTLKISIKSGRIFIFISSVEKDKIARSFDILKKQVIATDGFSKKL